MLARMQDDVERKAKFPYPKRHGHAFVQTNGKQAAGMIALMSG
jgi:hypothetical protein